MADRVLERVARKLCSLDGFPEDIWIDGQPMWAGYTRAAQSILEIVAEGPAPSAHPGYADAHNHGRHDVHC